MILCKHCGYQVFSIATNCFLPDGSDAEFHYTGTENAGAMCFELPESWCAYGLSDEERIESIKCPRCRKFPFSESAGVGVHTVVHVVCWEEEEKDA
jgi:hypothetical protein